MWFCKNDTATAPQQKQPKTRMSACFLIEVLNSFSGRCCPRLKTSNASISISIHIIHIIASEIVDNCYTPYVLWEWQISHYPSCVAKRRHPEAKTSSFNSPKNVSRCFNCGGEPGYTSASPSQCQHGRPLRNDGSGSDASSHGAEKRKEQVSKLPWLPSVNM